MTKGPRKSDLAIATSVALVLRVGDTLHFRARDYRRFAPRALSSDGSVTKRIARESRLPQSASSWQVPCYKRTCPILDLLRSGRARDLATSPRENLTPATRRRPNQPTAVGRGNQLPLR